MKVAAATFRLISTWGLLSLAQTAFAIPQEEQVQRRTVVVADHYAVGALRQRFFGTNYRAAWGMPIEVEVLDLGREGGGLTPVMKVGRLQTRGLALRGDDGRSYTFRELDKDPTKALPPELQNTAVADIAQDQISANFPGASVAANRLAQAIGLLQVVPRFVVMPDDARLGQFREEFAGLVGTLQEYPTPGTFDATEIIDGREMWDRLTAASTDRLDTRVFLRARLVDLLLGDWDRHLDQWRFARIPGSEHWQPIPEDHDEAFSSFEGLAMGMVRDKEPKFVTFGSKYASLEGLGWNSRSIDRRLLVGLDLDAWRQVAAELQTSVTDEIIEHAINGLPREYVELFGGELGAALRARRDGLAREAELFYRFLAPEVDVRTTNAAELVVIDRRAGGEVEVSAFAAAQVGAGVCDAPPADGAPFFRRRFRPADTGEIRIYTGAGDDRVLVKGPANGAITVRVIGGDGDNLLCEQPSNRTLRFDLSSAGETGAGTRVAEGLWLSPSEPIETTGTPAERQGKALVARRDWGSTHFRRPWFGAGPDLGVFVGMGLVRERFGFRHRPYASQQQVRLGFSLGVGRPRLDYQGDFRRENSSGRILVRGVASGIETLNFHGFGNETPQVGDRRLFRVKTEGLSVEPRMVFELGPTVAVSTGPVVRYTSTNTSGEDADRLIAVQSPYGVDNIGQVGWVAGLSFNDRVAPGTRDIKGSDDILRWGPAAVGTGFSADIDARYYPEVWDLEDDYLLLEGVGTAAFWLRDLGVGVGLRVGGQKNYGRFPYFDAAFLGARKVRGLRANRFAGDSALYGNATVLVRVGHATLVVPGRWGLMARADTGRVWLEGEASDTWHWGVGGGLWWSPWDFQNAVRILVSHSDEGTEGYLLLGFGF